jgi:AcrR family transcriptional regulator
VKEPTRRDQAAEEARTRILSAAADCLVRDGLAGVRMAGIAKAAGVSSGLLHYHFDTKEQLFAAVLHHCSRISDELTERALDSAGTQPAERLSSFLDRCLPSDDKLRRDWRVWQELDLLTAGRPSLSRVRSELYDTIYRAVAGILREGTRAKVFEVRSRDVPAVAEAVVALCDGLGSRVLADGDLSLRQARERVALAVGLLVGHDGPLPVVRTVRVRKSA